MITLSDGLATNQSEQMPVLIVKEGAGGPTVMVIALSLVIYLDYPGRKSGPLATKWHGRNSIF